MTNSTVNSLPAYTAYTAAHEVVGETINPTMPLPGPARKLILNWMKECGVHKGVRFFLTKAEIIAAWNDKSGAAVNELLTRTPKPLVDKPAVSDASAHVSAVQAATDDGETNHPESTMSPVVLPQPVGDGETFTIRLPRVGFDETKVRSIVEPAVSSAVQPVADAVADLKAQMAGVLDIADKLKADAKTATRAALVVAAATGNKLLDAMLKYYKPGVYRETKLCLTSPPGFGKSYAAKQLGRSYDLYLEHGCSPDLDEITTLKGGPVPDTDGNFHVIDGVLTQAVRAAAAGKTVLLLLDEIFRLPHKAQDWLLTFLVPESTPEGPIFRLRTNHADGGKFEVLTCPAGKLHIIAATNLSFDKPHPAFWDRFRMVRVEFDKDLIAEAARVHHGPAFGVELSERFCKKFADIMAESRQLVKAGTIAYPVGFRQLRTACEFAATPTDADVAKELLPVLQDQVLNWDGDTGDTIPASNVIAAWEGYLSAF